MGHCRGFEPYHCHVFEIEKRSPQVADDDPATLDVIESEISGFEAQISGAINGRWSVYAGVSTLEGEQVNRETVELD